MELQEIFTKVVTHLRAQGKPAMYDGLCVYRTEDGCSCAVGCLISDEAYSSEIEESNVFNHKVQEALIKSGVDISYNDETYNILRDLQMSHDGCTGELDYWNEKQEKEWERIAGEYDLEVPE